MNYEKTRNDGDEILTCTCCGTGIHDTPEENASHGEEPYPHDTGFGACRECFGEEVVEESASERPIRARRPKKASEMTDAEFKRSLGWAGRTFYEARFEALEKSLNEANREKFAKLPYKKKVAVVAGLVEKGAMI